MDLKIIIIITLSLISATCIQAQSNTNIISCNDFKEISFNGKTIEQINTTNAEPQNVQQLFGSYSSVEELGENRSRTFNYGDNRIGFTYDVQTFVTRITITNEQWPIVIQGNSIKVEDTMSSLKQAFGENLIIGESQYISHAFISFGCEGIDEGVNLKIDPQTNKVMEIVYYVSP